MFEQALKTLCFSLLLCGVSTGCGQKGGKATFDFLKAERGVLDNTKTQLKQYPFPKSPLPPDLLGRMSRQDRLAKTNQYHNDLNIYLNTVIENCQQSERIFNDAETTLSGLDSAGASVDAINLTKSYENVFGDQVQVLVEIEALAQLDKAKLNDTQRSKELIVSMIPGIIESVATENPTFVVHSFLSGVSNDAKRDVQRNQETQSHLARLEGAVTTFKHDAADMVTERSELVTEYNAKYPKLLWNQLLPAPVQTSKSQSN